MWQAIREANFLQLRLTNNLIFDHLILHKLWVSDKHAKAPKVLPVLWVVPLLGWLKVNMDGAAAGALSLASYGGNFQTYRGFVKGFFVAHIPSTFAYEFELHTMQWILLLNSGGIIFGLSVIVHMWLIIFSIL